MIASLPEDSRTIVNYLKVFECINPVESDINSS